MCDNVRRKIHLSPSIKIISTVSPGCGRLGFPVSNPLFYPDAARLENLMVSRIILYLVLLE